MWKDALISGLKCDYAMYMKNADDIYMRCGECDKYDFWLAQAADVAMELLQYGVRV